jgi:parallel beta-helix repeat protein
MKIFKLSFICSLFAITLATAQYTTPDTGVTWNLDDLATESPETLTVSGSTYTLLQNLIIAENDALSIDQTATLEIEDDVRITVFGAFSVTAEDVLITAVDQNLPYEGFRFEEFSEINIQNATIEYGGGLQVLTEDFTLNNCILQHNVSGTATGATVTMSRGVPVITNNSFLFNANPAMSSGANQSVSAYIFNNYIEGNNQTNNNRPQINMGATRSTDTLKIIQNTIVGDRDLDQAGGIAVANLVGGTLLAIIEENVIIDNRYGITLMGPNSYGLIRNNIIENNDTQGNPNLGGSGINLNAPTGGMEVDLIGNQIRGNLWGITIQGAVAANLGDDEDNPGGNIFSENGNNDTTFALYNNGLNTISAKHNCWVEDGEGTLEEAEDVIFHMVDDPDLGEVIFDPINCNEMSTPDFSANEIQLYPNPAQNQVSFSNTNYSNLVFYDLQGKKVFEANLNEGENTVNFNLKSGMYFLSFQNGATTVVKKLIVK